MLHWINIAAWGTAAGALVLFVRNVQSVIGGFLSAGRWLRGLSNCKATSSGIPKRTVSVIQENQINSLWWHQGSWNDKPMLQVVGDFSITNIWTKNVTVPAAILCFRQHWYSRLESCRGEALVKDVRGPYSGRCGLPPNVTTGLRVLFTVPNVQREERRPLNATVVVVDQFDNRHAVRGLVFKNTNHMLP